MRDERRMKVFGWAVIGCCALLAWAGVGSAPALAAAAAPAKAAAEALYDPGADPAAQLATAVEEARASGRRIVLEVGGDWCIWCHHLHDFLASHGKVRKAWDDAFVTVDVNYSPENKNEKFLRQYPEIPGYPHLFVLDSSGTLLHSQSTGDFETGQSYSEPAMLDFIAHWAPPRAAR